MICYQSFQVFLTVDLTTRYWHCVLVEESSLLTTFSTPFGRYKWNRLPFGLSASSKIFEKRVNQALDRLDGILNITMISSTMVLGQQMKKRTQTMIES